MANQEPIKTFLNGVTYLVQTAENYAVPQDVMQYHQAMQAREDAMALMLRAEEVLMFLRQRLMKLPPLPDIRSLPLPQEPQEENEHHA